MDISFYRFVTIHACARQMDRQTEFSSLDRVCIACSAVKINQCDANWSTLVSYASLSVTCKYCCWSKCSPAFIYAFC